MLSHLHGDPHALYAPHARIGGNKKGKMYPVDGYFFPSSLILFFRRKAFALCAGGQRAAYKVFYSQHI